MLKDNVFPHFAVFYNITSCRNVAHRLLCERLLLMVVEGAQRSCTWHSILRVVMSAFGDNVRWLRTRAGLTQAALADRINAGRHRGVAQQYVSALESGDRDPRLRTIRSIAKALHVKPWYLLAELSDNREFWDGYLALPPQGKRDIQRHIEYILERRGS